MLAREQTEAMEWRLSRKLRELGNMCPAHTRAQQQTEEIRVVHVQEACLQIRQILQKVARRSTRTRDFVSDIVQENEVRINRS